MGRNLGKNIIEHLNEKCSPKLLDCAKKSTTDAIKIASKIAIQNTAKATENLIVNKITDNITKISKYVD